MSLHHAVSEGVGDELRVPMPGDPTYPPARRWSSTACRWLCELGPVIGLFTMAKASDRIPADVPWPAQPSLCGLVAATEIVAEIDVDSRGLHQWLWFGAPDTAFGLCPLPDSDYYVWDRLLSELRPGHARFKSECWAGWSRRVGFGWNAMIGRFAMLSAPSRSVLAWHPAPSVSEIGRELFERIVVQRGAIAVNCS